MKTLQVISVIRNILMFILMFYSVYQAVFCLLAYIRPPKKQKLFYKNHRFMAVVSARNEEKVIGHLIDTLQRQHYPSGLLDIYVIADNCTDQTAQVARQAGAIVFERFDETKKSKGYALEWFFDKVLEEFPDKYDAFCIFDADNLVEPNFIRKMNDKLCEGEVIVQGYRDIKNPGDNWLSGNGALYFWSLNRLYHYARYKLGLSSFVQGTGFMVKMDVIKEEEGWHATALTEDIEFSFMQIAKGRKIGWANDAVLYDEQPTDFMQSWNQKLRWGVGNVQCVRKCVPLLLRAKQVTPIIIDGFIYLMSIPILVLSILLGVLNFILISALPTWSEIGTACLIQLISSAIFITAAYLQAIIVVKFEGKSLKQVWKGILTYPIFLGLTFVVNFCAIFKQKLAWKPIEHVKAIALRDLEK